MEVEDDSKNSLSEIEGETKAVKLIVRDGRLILHQQSHHTTELDTAKPETMHLF